jgi:hypothetical protein
MFIQPNSAPITSCMAKAMASPRITARRRPSGAQTAISATMASALTAYVVSLPDQ